MHLTRLPKRESAFLYRTLEAPNLSLPIPHQMEAAVVPMETPKLEVPMVPPGPLREQMVELVHKTT